MEILCVILWVIFFGKCGYDRTGKEDIVTIDRIRKAKILYEICRWHLIVS